MEHFTDKIICPYCYEEYYKEITHIDILNFTFQEQSCIKCDYCGEYIKILEKEYFVKENDKSNVTKIKALSAYIAAYIFFDTIISYPNAPISFNDTRKNIKIIKSIL